VGRLRVGGVVVVMAVVEDFADTATCTLGDVAGSAAKVTTGAAGLGLWREGCDE
jgi:hypothetical protein